MQSPLSCRARHSSRSPDRYWEDRGFCIASAATTRRRGNRLDFQKTPARSGRNADTRTCGTGIEEFQYFGKRLRLRTVAVFGGVIINRQINELGSDVDVLVATPGRLLDLCNQRAVRLDTVQTLVLDEADRMLDMGLRPTFGALSRSYRSGRRCCSPQRIRRRSARSLVTSCATPPLFRSRLRICGWYGLGGISVSPGGKTAVTVASFKRQRLVSGVGIQPHETRREPTCNAAVRSGVEAMAIHGNKSQSARTRALAFKSGEVRVLVATDIAARGLDIPEIDVDQLRTAASAGRLCAPNRAHRAGGHTGHAIALVNAEEERLLNAIEKQMNQSVERVSWQGASKEVGPADERAEERRNEPQPQKVNKRRNRRWRPRKKNAGQQAA